MPPILTIELAVDDLRCGIRCDGATRGDSCCDCTYCWSDGVEVELNEAKLSIDFRGLGAPLISFEERPQPSRDHLPWNVRLSTQQRAGLLTPLVDENEKGSSSFLAWNWAEQQLPSGEAIGDVDRMTLLPIGEGVPWLGRDGGRRGNTWSRASIATLSSPNLHFRQI